MWVCFLEGLRILLILSRILVQLISWVHWNIIFWRSIDFILKIMTQFSYFCTSQRTFCHIVIQLFLVKKTTSIRYLKRCCLSFCVTTNFWNWDTDLCIWPGSLRTAWVQSFWWLAVSIVEFHLKFTYTKNLNIITHNLLPGNSSLTFTFKSKKKTFPFVRNLNPYLVIPKYCKFVHLKISSVIQENWREEHCLNQRYTLV